MAEERGSIAFFSTYRPPVPLDIYASPISPASEEDEKLMTDGKSYNYNGHQIPPAALKTIFRNTDLGERARTGVQAVDSGYVSGMVFVSERTNNLETLQIGLRFDTQPVPRVKVYNFAQLYEQDMDTGVRMEDSPCFAGAGGGRYLIYVSTVEPNEKRRQPWTAVYRTDLRNGETVRLTPEGVADFSPSVSPCGRKVAVATLEYKEGGWTGEIEDLETDIVVMDVKDPSNRERVIQDGGWPSWGNDDVLYFHRAFKKPGPIPTMKYYNWGIFRANVRDGFTSDAYPMTPDNVDAMTPAAIDSNRVAVAIIRDKLDLAVPRNSPHHYRHVAVFDSRREKPLPVTRRTNTTADHYNPFVIKNSYTGEVLIGYNRCSGEQLERGDISENFDVLETEDPDEVAVFRVPGVFPTFTEDGEKLAFVDNDFQNVYLADRRGGLRVIFSVSDPGLRLAQEQKSVFSPVWNQKAEKDTLYVCVGPPFSADKQVHIYAIFNASSNRRRTWRLLTSTNSNNAFPSTDPEGTKLVFRSTKDWVGRNHNSPIRPKNLYIMDAQKGDRKAIRRLTRGAWVDTHCQWSPNGDWIVFSSTRDKPRNAPLLDNGLDSGYYAVYLMMADDPNVWVRVISSGSLRAGHVNHPMFSPDGESIVFSSDLAGVSVEPISLPLFIHSVRPYGDLFKVNIDPVNIHANKDIREFDRITHSRYENSTPSWSSFSTRELSGAWKQLFRECQIATWNCPYGGGDSGSGESWQMTGHLGLSKRCC